LLGETIRGLSAWLWGTPMLLGTAAAGLWLSLRLRFLPVRRLGTALRAVCGRGAGVSGAGGVSPRRALCTALAGTGGTGNIAGVAGALAAGGPGAIFWMWAAALLNMTTKYAEVALAVRWRERGPGGGWRGGPMCYIERGLGRRGKPLSVLFCAAGMGAALAMGNLTQLSVVAAAVNTAAQALRPETRVPWTAVGVPCALLLGATLLGGARRVGAAAEKLVPLMSALYLCGTLAVIVFHLPRLPGALRGIVRGAFCSRALGGGLAGVSLRTALRAGVSRGVFSNEAGLGSAPIAHAAAESDSPARQGLCGVVEVFADTVVLCSLTALAILCSGVAVPYGGAAGAELLTQALGTVFSGPLPAVLTALGLALFALSSALSWGYYGARCAEHLLGGAAAGPYRLLFCGCAALGPGMAPALAWDLADLCNALMALPNLLALTLLAGEAARLTERGLRRDFNSQIKH
jgi:AGCS family alanine or glycine:cation symporter